MILFKNKEKWGNFGGNINIYQDLNTSDIDKLICEPNIHSIQFYEFKTPNNKTWTVINDLYKNYPEIGLTIFWYDPLDFDFINKVSNVKDLSIKSYLTNDFTPILRLKELKALHIGETKLTSVDLSFINNFSSLRILSIDGMKKGLESIQNLHDLWSLNLRGVKLKNLDFIGGLNNLRLLKLMFGSYESLSSLKKLSELEYLGISRTRKISDYEFLKSLHKLQFLHFEGLSQMESLPDFSGLKELKKLQIENLSKLSNINSVRQLSQLKEFLLFIPENFKASLRDSIWEQAYLIMLGDLKNLELTNLFYWDKDGKMIELEKRGIKKWNYGLTKWKQNSEGGWTL